METDSGTALWVSRKPDNFEIQQVNSHNIFDPRFMTHTPAPSKLHVHLKVSSRNRTSFVDKESLNAAKA